MAQGLLTRGITLAYKDGTFKDLPDLMDIPDMGGEVEKVEITTLADASRRYINGIKDFGDLAFTFLYSNEAATDSYTILQALEAEYEADPTKEPTEFQVEFPDGTTFTFAGFPSVVIAGAGVNEALTFTLNIALNTAIVVA
jgi:hypothetical protein